MTSCEKEKIPASSYAGDPPGAKNHSLLYYFDELLDLINVDPGCRKGRQHSWEESTGIFYFGRGSLKGGCDERAHDYKGYFQQN